MPQWILGGAGLVRVEQLYAAEAEEDDRASAGA